MSVLAELPEPHRSVVAGVLRGRAPALLAELETKGEPTAEEWDAVLDILDDAASEHWLPGSDYEMDEQGLAIEYAQGAFNNAFIHVKSRDR